MQRLEDDKQAAESSRKMQLAARVQQEEQADRNALLILQVRARSSMNSLVLVCVVASRVGPMCFAFASSSCYYVY